MSEKSFQTTLAQCQSDKGRPDKEYKNHLKVKRNSLRPMQGNPRQSWNLDFTPRIPVSGHWIPDFTSKKLSDSFTWGDKFSDPHEQQ